MGKNASLAVLAAVLLVATAWLFLRGNTDRGAAPSVPRGTAVLSSEASPEPSPIVAAEARVLEAAEAPGQLPAPPEPTPRRVVPGVEQAPASGFDLAGRVRDASGGTWVEGAEVTFYGRDDEGAWQPFATRSGPEGRFLVSAVALVPSALSVRMQGFAPFNSFRWSLRDLAAALAEGRPFDLGTIELQRGALITGRVLDTAGRGVPAASIYRIFHYYGGREHGNIAPTGHVSRVADADDQGDFTLADRLAFVGEGPYEQVLAAIAPHGMGWTALELLQGKGEVENVTITIQDGASLELLVKDHAGQPLEGASVRMRARFEPFFGIGGFDEHFWHGDVESLERIVLGVTSPTGRVSFEGLPLWQPSGSRLSATDSAYDVNNPYQVQISLADRSWSEEIELSPGHNTLALVVGHRPVRSIAGRVLDPAGEPIVGARVACLEREARSFSDGSYLIDRVVTGEPSIELTASADGFADLHREILLSESLLIENVDLVLAAHAAVEGIVVDDTGEAVAESRLYLDRPPDHGQRGTRFATLSAEDGSFSFPEASAGPWYLNAWPPGSVQEWQGVKTLRVQGGDRQVRIELARAQPGSARLVAHVIDADTRAALDPTAVRLLPRIELEPGAQTPVPPTPKRVAGGAVVEGVRPGAYRMWARAASGEPAHVDFEVAETDTELELTIAVGGPASLSGRVVLDGTIDPAHARVSAQIVDSRSSLPWGDEWKTTAQWHDMQPIDANGSFRFEALIPGRYEVKLHHFAVLAEETVELSPGNEARATLHPHPGAVWLFTGQAPADEGWVFLEVEHPAAPWKSGPLWLKIENRRVQHRVLTPPGRISWQASYNKQNSLTALPDKTDQGNATATATSEHEIVIRLR